VGPVDGRLDGRLVEGVVGSFEGLDVRSFDGVLEGLYTDGLEEG
jgi:hypothetical protein